MARNSARARAAFFQAEASKHALEPDSTMEAQENIVQARRWMDFCTMLDDLAEDNFSLEIATSVAAFNEVEQEQNE